MSWIPSWDEEGARVSLLKHRETVQEAAFFWFYTDNERAIRTYRDVDSADRLLLSKSVELGIRPIAVITNLAESSSANQKSSNEWAPAEPWDAETIEQILSNPKWLTSHIEDLVALVKDSDFEGLQIDYEFLSGSVREEFSEFIRRLSYALKQHDKALSVVVHPKTGEFIPRENNGSWAQDWRELSRHTEKIVLMAYGEHYPGSEPGPIASPSWLDRLLKFAIFDQRIEPSRLTLALATYAEIWKRHRYNGSVSSPSGEFTYQSVLDLEMHHGFRVRDKASASPYLSFKDEDGRRNFVWFEDAFSIARKLEVARSYGINNLAFWRLGREDPEIWGVVEDWFDRSPGQLATE